MSGKILVLEGTDFSGKSTQYELLHNRLLKEGYVLGTESFPVYDSNSSFFVKQYLRGMYGEKPSDVSAKCASLFYALDRYNSYKENEWGKIYDAGGNILFSRYLTSNILHQASKLNDAKAIETFIDWVYDLEVGTLGIPKEDKVIFLNMPPEMGQKLKQKRLKEQGGKTSSGTETDIHEADTEYLRHTYETGIKIATKLNWVIVNCVDEYGKLRSILDINDELFKVASQLYIF